MTTGVTGNGPSNMPQPAVQNRLTDLKYRFPARYLASWGALLVLLVFALVVAPASLGGNSVKVVSALAGILALAAMGQMLVVMLGAIDLSVSAVLAASAGFVVHYGVPGANLWLVIPAALVVSLVVSVVNGFFICVLRLNSIIVTLATYGIVTGGMLLWTGVSFSLTGEAPEQLQQVSQWSFLNINTCFLVALIVGLIVAAVLSYTRAGRRVAQVGSNPRAATALGVRVTLVQMSTFAAVGLLYGIAGVFLAGFIGTPDISIGAPYQLATVTAAAIAGLAFSGGPTSVASLLVSCVFLQLLDQALVVAGFSTGARIVIQGFALVVAVAAITISQYGIAGIRRIAALQLGRPVK
ncbi:ABC transporter permease [Pseudarthrobacter phenanthrenivorans]|nr:ABC transporter permease [Pseudarthrobacter phenanthrenivorans]